MKVKKYLPVITASFLLLLVGCKSKKDQTAESSLKGTSETKEIAIEEYDKINTAIPFTIVYHQKDEPASLRLEGDAYLISKLQVVTQGGILQLSCPADLDTTETLPLTIYTNSKELSLIATADKEQIHLHGEIKGSKLDIRNNGVAYIMAENLQYKALAITLKGLGTYNLEGKVTAASFNISGSGEILSPNLEVGNLDIYSYGSGNAHVYATQSLYVVSNGSGNVYYKGKPKKIDSKVRGTGKVEAEK